MRVRNFGRIVCDVSDPRENWAVYLREKVLSRMTRTELIDRAGTRLEQIEDADGHVVPVTRNWITKSTVGRWLNPPGMRVNYETAKRVGEVIGDVQGALAAAGYREIDTSDPDRPIVEIKADDGDDWDITLVLPSGQDQQVTQADIKAAKAAAQAAFEAVLEARKDVRQTHSEGAE